MYKIKKKENQSEQIPKPIKIKKEKTEEDRALHPMSHYVDDRLELVKQIFGSLKPKTIINLAPEFLKKKNLEDIEEQCLNELLCISTKRLLSIINATKCPTDTESSEDSDVEHKEEHISLEEISSDSEIEDTSKKVKRKKKLAATENKNIKKTADKDEPEGQISVLELLELQARARAIRSQLALEPVTKIEVDSEGEQPKEKIPRKIEGKVRRSEQKQKSNDTDERPSTSKSIANSSNISANGSVKDAREEPTERRTTKKIKLKRNYRSTKTEREFEEKTSESKEKRKSPEIQQSSFVKTESAGSRSASPDVIPIQQEPETLLISDSSADEATADNKEKGKSKTGPELTATAAPQEPVNSNRERKISEPEDGEITEPDDKENADNESNVCSENVGTKDAAQPTNAADKTEESVEATPETQTEVAERLNETETSQTSTQESVQESSEDKPRDTTESTSNDDRSNQMSILQNSESNHSSNYNVEVNEHDDEDVISIEGGDLETEIEQIEQLANDEVNEEQKSSATIVNDNSQDVDDDDIISLDTSEDDQEKPQSTDNESWHSRYLKSSKVSQVLAASRLGKRVRDKIKKSKHRDNELREKQAEVDAAEKSRQTFTSKHEDGSIEQYKELLELRQRKN